MSLGQGYCGEMLLPHSTPEGLQSSPHSEVDHKGSAKLPQLGQVEGSWWTGVLPSLQLSLLSPALQLAPACPVQCNTTEPVIGTMTENRFYLCMGISTSQPLDTLCPNIWSHPRPAYIISSSLFLLKKILNRFYLCAPSRICSTVSKFNLMGVKG